MIKLLLKRFYNFCKNLLINLHKFINKFLLEIDLNGYFFNDLRQSVYKKNLYEDNLNMDISNIYDESILDKNDNLFILRDFFRYVETFEDKLSDASLGCIKVRYFNKWKYKLLTEDYTISIDIDDSKFEDIESYINEERFFD